MSGRHLPLSCTARCRRSPRRRRRRSTPAPPTVWPSSSGTGCSSTTARSVLFFCRAFARVLYAGYPPGCTRDLHPSIHSCIPGYDTGIYTGAVKLVRFGTRVLESTYWFCVSVFFVTVSPSSSVTLMPSTSARLLTPIDSY